MKKFLIFCLVVALIGGLAYGGYYLYNNTDLLDRFFDKEEIEITCTVNFESNGGSAIDSQTVENGKTIEHPGIPVREGFAFVGWYTSNDFEKLFDFSKPIKKSCTVYAHWVDTTDTTDTDGDGLTDPVEEFYGTDTKKVDTDNDGLSDYQEIAIFNLDPLKEDTDGNGVNDGNEDSDGDSLSNLMELSLGTNPMAKDTDGDNLSDSEELNTYKTNPIIIDTDEDGADDGWEVLNSFDPLTFNATFDIVVKADNVSEGSAISALVQIEVGGEQASALKVEEVVAGSHALITGSIPGYLGSAYDFSTKGEIESATITFEYDTSIGEISDDFQPRIYYFNEELGILEELENQTVEDGRISVVVTHFSKYILLNKVEFDKVWESEIKPPNYEEDKKTGLDIVFVIDSSGSMTSNDAYGIRLSAVIEFINKLGKNDRGAVIDFDSSAQVYQTFTNDKDALANAVNRVDSSGGTNLGKGIKAAIDQFTSMDYTRTDAYKYIVFLTDGDGSYASSYTSLAAQNDIVIYTIGLGSGVRDSVLKKIANGTGGKYYFVSVSTNLPDIYNEVSFETIDYSAHTNNDGISDYYTRLIYEGTLVLSNGSDQFKGIDFNYDALGNLCDDYDGDGIKNGDELVVVRLGDIIYMEMKSDPTKKDTDHDGILDNKDSARLAKGLEDGLVGKLTLVSCYNTEDASWTSGHTFLVYTSYINDNIDFSSLAAGWSKNDIAQEWSWNNLGRDSVASNSYYISIGDSVTIGNGAFGAGWFGIGDGLGSLGNNADISGDSNESGAGEENGVCYNMELYKHLSPDIGYSYLNNTCLSEEITLSELETLIAFLSQDTVNYWNLIHNCAEVACMAWNKISDIDVNPYHDDFMSGNVATPKGLKINLRTLPNSFENYVLAEAFN